MKNNNLCTQLDHEGIRKLPCPTWRRNWCWKHDVYSRKTKKVFSPSPLLLGLQNYSPITSHPPSCKPHKLKIYPIQINHFLAIILPLAEFFLHWDIKDWSSLENPSRRPEMPQWFQQCSWKRLSRKIINITEDTALLFWYFLTLSQKKWTFLPTEPS